jgi:hypothetical protein
MVVMVLQVIMLKAEVEELAQQVVMLGLQILFMELAE